MEDHVARVRTATLGALEVLLLTRRTANEEILVTASSELTMPLKNLGKSLLSSHNTLLDSVGLMNLLLESLAKNIHVVKRVLI